MGDSESAWAVQVGVRAMTRLRNAAFLVGAIGMTVGLGLILDGIVGSHLIWGGTVCNQSGMIAECVGYPPTGVMILAIVSAFVCTGVWSGVSKVSKRFERCNV